GWRLVVSASSSSVYGNTSTLPKQEEMPPAPMSPYALQKLTGELLCSVFTRIYPLETVALRYFNVFGPRQDPASEYAAVIPKFVLAALEGRPVEIHGDGAQSRDFTEVENVVEANVLAADADGAGGEVFNVGCGARVSLLDIVGKLELLVGRRIRRRFTESRAGDVRHSEADIDKARRVLGYVPKVEFDEGLQRVVEYFQGRRPVGPCTS